MRKKRIHKTFGIVLALSLPITLIGAVSLILMFPSQELYKEMGWNQGMNNHWMRPWMDSDDWGHMGNSSKTANLTDGDSEVFKSLRSIQVRGMVDHVNVEKSTSDQVELSYAGNETIHVSVMRNRLIISTARNGLNLNSIIKDAGELVIRIPDGLRELDIDPGASHITITEVSLQDLDIEMGVGDLNINRITVSKDTDIDGGRGSIMIQDSEFNKLDIEGGIGTITLNTITANVVELDSGIGSIAVNDSTIDYLKTDKGLGSIDLNNNTIRKHKRD